jgi:CheY-like chemotaxis protein
MNNQKSIRHIVLVDDDQDDCEMFGEALHEFDKGLTLSCLNDNEQLLSFLREKAPDMIFLDVNMPKKSGYDCLKEIRAEASLDGIPVVMYSNTGRPEDIQQAYLDGANLFLRKPITYRQLVEALKELVEKDWSFPSRITAAYFRNGRYFPV